MICYSPGSARTAAVAETLAAAFDLWCTRRGGVDERRAALTVAEPSERRHFDPATAVVVVPAGARARLGLSGRIVLCGIEDESDAPAAATAGAIASALGVQLVLAHVIPPPAAVAPGPIAPPLVRGLTVEDSALAREMVGSVARAAGLDDPGTLARRVLRGTPAPTLAAVARAEDAALVVVSASVRPLLVRAFLGSATRHLARRLDRLLMVCPRDPRPAMRLREALSSSPTHAWWSR
jgi:nucleotide-binding universal stress UspA family protein